MENSQVIALVAIAISVISIGLVVASVFNLQTILINLNTSMVEQSQTIRALNEQQNASQQLIEEQKKSIMTMQDNITNLTSEAKSLEDKVTSLEQRLQSQCLIPEGCQPPTPQKPVYFPGVVKFYNAEGGGGVTENRVFKQLPSTLSADHWVADFDYSFTASTIPAAYPLALTSSSADPEQQGTAGSAVIVYHGDNSDVLHLRVSHNGAGDDSPGLYTGIPIYQNTHYYVRLGKTPTELTLSVFSDPARTVQIPGSPVTMAIASTEFNNLRFIQHAASLSSGSGRTLTAEVDNMKISIIASLGNKQTFFEDGYTSNAGWTQIGTSVAVNGSFVPQVIPGPYTIP